MGLNLTEMQAQKVRETLTGLYAQGREPNMEMLHGVLLAQMPEERYKETKLQLTYITNKLRQASEIFGDEPEGFWKGYEERCNVVDMHELTDAEKKLVTYTIVQRIIEEFRQSREIRLYIALDDAYQALLNYYGKETNITRVVREGRKYGFGIIAATQLLQDVPDAIVGNTAVKFVLGYHEPALQHRVHAMLNMSGIEKDILYRMPIGSAFMFDQRAVQAGRPNPAYVEIDVIGREERRELEDKAGRIDVKEADGGKRYDAGAKAPRLAGEDVPSVSVYLYMLAMHMAAGNVEEAGRICRERKWITSARTLYGGAGIVPIRQRLMNEGYLKGGRLTGRALETVDPDRMIEKQGEHAGSETHRMLMKKVIKELQERGEYAFVGREKESFDVVGMERARRKGAWDRRSIKAYEVQTNARKEEILKCIEKARGAGYGLVFVTNDRGVESGIRKIAGKGYEIRVLGQKALGK